MDFPRRVLNQIAGYFSQLIPLLHDSLANFEEASDPDDFIQRLSKIDFDDEKYASMDSRLKKVLKG